MTRTCELCQGTISSEEAFMNMPEDKVVHEKCFNLGPCPACGKPLRLTEDLMGAGNHKYHVGCFKCTKCSKELQSFVMDKDNKPLCRECALEQNKQAQQKALGNCAACKQAITATQRGFNVDDEMYHVDCFVCTSCKGSLAGGCSSYENQLYCGPCLQKKKDEIIEQSRHQLHEQQAAAAERHRASQTICVECNKPITSQALQALGRSWHVDCIKCFKCRKQMTGQLFAINNEPHCGDCSAEIRRQAQQQQQQTHEQENQQKAAAHQSQQDKERAERELSHNLENQATLKEYEAAKARHDALQKVQCDVCKLVITGEYQELNGTVYCNQCAEVVQQSIKCDVCHKLIDTKEHFRRALGKFYHQACFKCAHCKTPIPTAEFKSEGGKIYCDDHYTELFGTHKDKCPSCHKPIRDGEVAVYNDIAYHNACVVCFHCKKHLDKGEFVPAKTGELFCKSCFVEGKMTEAKLEFR